MPGHLRHRVEYACIEGRLLEVFAGMPDIRFDQAYHVFTTVSKVIAGLRWIQQRAAGGKQQQCPEHRTTGTAI